MIPLTQGIRLYSGVMFDYNEPHRAEVTIEDIAHALSNICRFAGHIKYFYSVAQHAVNVSRLVPPELALTALLHDTAEAFTNDLPTPLKVAFPIFKSLEDRIEAAMADRFGFTYPLPPEVKCADLQMLLVEKQILKDDYSEWEVLQGVEWPCNKQLWMLETSPSEAKRRFLNRYWELTNEKS